ncbi:hypothetical protein IWQ62_000436 [Dispira parvispora]|uniref:NADP-dependent oxidoreductase domain-containing protein n=1 Tax=Dispira parvispora TaxID=1520584 RepID=A0A9W8EA62_9FUNG|nr:hypothetical protein IWQ62_000436 [Dispira parvispora]
MLTRAFQLFNGYWIPAVGLGTWHIPRQELSDVVQMALGRGYKYFDTATIYPTIDVLGDTLYRYDLNREVLFLSCKLWPSQYQPSQVQPAVEQILKELQTDYLDAVLLHFPFALRPSSPEVDPHPPLAEGNHTWSIDRSFDIGTTWHVLEDLVRQGMIRSLGTSNFSVQELEELLDKVNTVPPAILQTELHPYHPNWELVEFCQKHGIHVTAGSPLGGTAGKALRQDPLIVELAQKYRRQPTQILLSWAVQRGTSVFARSTDPARIASNKELVSLSEADMGLINAIKTRKIFLNQVLHTDLLRYTFDRCLLYTTIDVLLAAYLPFNSGKTTRSPYLTAMSSQSTTTFAKPELNSTSTQADISSSQTTPRVIPHGATSTLALINNSAGTGEQFGRAIPELQFGDDFYDMVMQKFTGQHLDPLDKLDRARESNDVENSPPIKSEALFPLVPCSGTTTEDQTPSRADTLVPEKANYTYEQGVQDRPSIRVSTKRRFKSVSDYVPTPYTKTKLPTFGKSRGDEASGLKDGSLELNPKTSVPANPTQPSSFKAPTWLRRNRNSEEGSRSVASLVATSIRRRARSHSRVETTGEYAIGS